MNEEVKGQAKKPDLQALVDRELETALPKKETEETPSPDIPSPGSLKYPNIPRVPLQKPIRTYESDVAEALSHQQTSLATMVVAEKEKQQDKRGTSVPVQPKIVPKPEVEKMEYTSQVLDTTPTIASNPFGNIPKKQEYSSLEQPKKAPIPQAPLKIVPELPKEEPVEEEDVQPRHSGKKILLVIMSILFLGGGVVGAYFLYLKSPLSIPEPVATQIKLPSVVTAQSQSFFPVGNLKGERLLAGISTNVRSHSPKSGEIHEVVPTYTKASSTLRLPASQFISQAEFSMSDVLSRSLLDRFMIGSYGLEDGSSLPFIIFTTDFFQNAYAGMLSWEEQIVDEFSPFFGIRQKLEEQMGAEQSTTSIATFFSIRGEFRDRIVRNRDVREFIGEKGELLFLYTFLDKDTVLITTSEAVISGVIDQVEKATYVR